MPPQSRRPRPGPPPEQKTPEPPADDTGPELVAEPPLFDPDDPQPGQSIRGHVPHAGYTSFAHRGRSFEVDPLTDCIVREIV